MSPLFGVDTPRTGPFVVHIVVRWRQLAAPRVVRLSIGLFECCENLGRELNARVDGQLVFHEARMALLARRQALVWRTRWKIRQGR